MTETDDVITLRRYNLWHKQGWFPVKWAHHSKEVKAVLRLCRWVPMGKQCWRNAQRFLIDAHRLAVAGIIEPINVSYVEGIAVGISTYWHAWLSIDGEDVDLTLDGAADRLTEHRCVVPLSEVLRNSLETQLYTTVRPKELMRLQWRAMGIEGTECRQCLGHVLDDECNECPQCDGEGREYVIGSLPVEGP